jgi:hypothetical protein
MVKLALLAVDDLIQYAARDAETQHSLAIAYDDFTNNTTEAGSQHVNELPDFRKVICLLLRPPISIPQS